MAQRSRTHHDSAYQVGALAARTHHWVDAALPLAPLGVAAGLLCVAVMRVAQGHFSLAVAAMVLATISGVFGALLTAALHLSAKW